MSKINLVLVYFALLLCSFYCTEKVQNLKKKEDLKSGKIIPNFHQLNWNASYSYPLEDCNFKLIKLDNDDAIIEVRCLNENNFEPYFILESVKIRAKNRDTFDIFSKNDLLNFQDVYYDKLNNTISYNFKKSSVTTIDLKSNLVSEITYLEDAVGTWENLEENSSSSILSFTKDSENNIISSIHSENEVSEKKVVFYSTDSGIISFDNSSVMYLEMGYNEKNNVDEIIVRNVKDGVFHSYSLNKAE